MRGFSDEERDRIRRDLHEAGRRLFSQYGLSKTTIADLTDEVGIGTSTFYRFFDSKEDLYLSVLEAEGEAVRRRLEAEGILDAAEGDPQAAVESFLTFIFEEIETNPLVRRLIVEGELDRLRDHRSEAAREADRRAEVAVIRSIVDPFLETGEIRGEDPELVARAIGAIPYLTLHEEDIGPDRYPEVRSFVVETFARGLVADPE
jgi:AcrR family transcriptional regulator